MEIQPGLTYLTRAQWGARTAAQGYPRLGWPVNRLDRTEAIMHHTVIIDTDATPNRWGSLAQVKAKIRQLQIIRPDLGLDVPYNFVAFHMEDLTLVICEGRGFDRTGAHTHGHNTRGIATAGEGNFQIGLSPSPYTDHWSRWWGYQKHDMGMENLGSSHPTGRIAYGHKDFTSTACPGSKLYAIIPQLIFKEEEMALDENTDKATFQKMLNAALNGTKVQAVDDDGNPFGSWHELSLMIYRIRQNDLRLLQSEAHANDATKHGGSDVSETRMREIADEEDRKQKALIEKDG